MKSVLKRQAFFVFLLPVFFVFHGFIEHYDFISLKDAFLLILLYVGGMLIITGISWLFFHNFMKAAFVSFFAAASFFFFGSIQDFLRDHFAGSFFSRYSFILPLFFLLLIAFIYWLKKAKASLYKLAFYLNIVLLLFFIPDLFLLGTKVTELKKRSQLSLSSEGLFFCDNCTKPDVYFIVLDEYSGNRALEQVFNFDNGEFEKELERRGFYVAKKSCSNYNYTPFSVASILNMKYLDLVMRKKAPGNIDYCYRQIKNSSVIKLFVANGYEFCNYSIFDFENRPAISYDNFLPNSTKLITSQTFLSRVLKDISYNISTGKWKIKFGVQKRTYEHLYNNENIVQLTKATAEKKYLKPKFVYAHLMMPHYPYYFNRGGEALAVEKLLPGQETNRENYIEYLQYCNLQILKLVDKVIAASDIPPIVMLLGDHGFREGIKKEEQKYVFMNLNAVYTPDKNYDRFYDSISNVNQFRVLLNTQFNQHIPLLKDSTIYLWGDP